MQKCLNIYSVSQTGTELYMILWVQSIQIQQTNYKKSKCLLDNIGKMTIDLQRLFCEYICFHDPELYDNCPNDHTGDIAVFADETFSKLQ